jgi:SAM-dependent methyltransferase
MLLRDDPQAPRGATHTQSLHERSYTDGTYLERNPTWHAEDSGWKADRCAALLSDLGYTPTSICDVGCGAGGVLAALRHSYPVADLSGFDISPTAVRLAREQHDGISFAEGSPTLHYDLMLVLDVIEHVEDCFGFTRGLRPHADLMVFNIPLELTCLSLMRHGLMGHRRALGHIHYFTRDTALALLSDCGYDVVVDRYIPAVVDFAAKDPKTRLLTAAQRAGHRVAPGLSVLALGGYSLLVAARPLP